MIRRSTRRASWAWVASWINPRKPHTSSARRLPQPTKELSGRRKIAGLSRREPIVGNAPEYGICQEPEPRSRRLCRVVVTPHPCELPSSTASLHRQSDTHIVTHQAEGVSSTRPLRSRHIWRLVAARIFRFGASHVAFSCPRTWSAKRYSNQATPHRAAAVPHRISNRTQSARRNVGPRLAGDS